MMDDWQRALVSLDIVSECVLFIVRQENGQPPRHPSSTKVGLLVPMLHVHQIRESGRRKILYPSSALGTYGSPGSMHN